MRNNIWQRVKNHALDDKWKIGIIEASFNDILAGNYSIKYLDAYYKDGWFADPFVLDVSLETFSLLVEEFYYPHKRGRISKLVVRRSDMKLLSVMPLLSIDTHLSFPAILRDQDHIYVYPENSYSGHLDIYEYVGNENQIVKHSRILDSPAIDAIIFNYGRNRYLSCTFPHEQSESVLHIFVENSSGEFTHFQDISFDRKIARNAGAWFEYEGKYYRPAQDCSKTYGGAVVLQEVILGEDGFIFKDCSRIESTDLIYSRGCHTFNGYCGLFAVDSKTYRRPIQAELLNSLFQI